MTHNESPLAATMRTREEFIKIAANYGNRLRFLREVNENPLVAVMRGGGLALVEKKFDSRIYKMGSVLSPLIAQEDLPLLVAKWNRENPNHELEIIPLQTAIERECVSVSIMLGTIEIRRRTLELKE